MITLTTPPQVITVLGSSTASGYDKFIVRIMRMDTKDHIITGQVEVSSTADPNGATLTGNLSINTGSGVLTLTIGALDIERKLALSAGQQTAVLGIIADAQDALESGLVSIGLVDGTQSTGT